MLLHTFTKNDEIHVNFYFSFLYHLNSRKIDFGTPKHIFDAYEEQQIFLTKNAFCAIFASNLVLAENRAKMPYFGSSKKFGATQNLENWSKTLKTLFFFQKPSKLGANRFWYLKTHFRLQKSKSLQKKCSCIPLWGGVKKKTPT